MQCNTLQIKMSAAWLRPIFDMFHICKGLFSIWRCDIYNRAWIYNLTQFFCLYFLFLFHHIESKLWALRFVGGNKRLHEMDPLLFYPTIDKLCCYCPESCKTRCRCGVQEQNSDDEEVVVSFTKLTFARIFSVPTFSPTFNVAYFLPYLWYSSMSLIHFVILYSPLSLQSLV